jgi:hypothetical protein
LARQGFGQTRLGDTRLGDRRLGEQKAWRNRKAARDLMKPDGLADVVPTDQGSVPSLR